MYCAKLFASRSLIPLLSFLLSQLNLSYAFTQCYYPDGSIPVDYVWEPCTGAEFSSCCIPTEGDICQPDGLCYYPPEGAIYRGACTDRTWNDPSCPTDICVTGYETTWNWVVDCDSNGSSKYSCGNVTDGEHNLATCDSNAAAETASYITTTTTSSASRYVSPTPIDTSLYSLYTSSYTTIISAWVQSTTFTTTWESTGTSTLAQSTAAGDSTSNGVSATNTASKNTPVAKNKVTLTTGVLIAVIVGPIAAITIGLGIFFWFRKNSAKKNAIKLSDTPYPPPNGPVGKDQVHPYEVDVNEATNYPPNPQKYTYVPPAQQTNELNGSFTSSQEKKWGEAVEMGGYEHSGLNSPGPRSPAPAYTQAPMAVELDGTSSLRGRRELQ